MIDITWSADISHLISIGGCHVGWCLLFRQGVWIVGVIKRFQWSNTHLATNRRTLRAQRVWLTPRRNYGVSDSMNGIRSRHESHTREQRLMITQKVVFDVYQSLWSHDDFISSYNALYISLYSIEGGRSLFRSLDFCFRVGAVGEWSGELFPLLPSCTLVLLGLHDMVSSTPNTRTTTEHCH